MPAYDSNQYDPPAPIALVTLRCADDAMVVTGVPMLLDTGADVTLIPESFVQRLGAAIETDKAFELVGFDGTRSVVASAELDLIFLSKAFRGRYLVTKESCGVLGRDVLNHLVLQFDGPKTEWTVIPSSAS